jgi:hypothetical protein
MKNKSALFSKIFGYIVISGGLIMMIFFIIKSKYDEYQIKNYGVISVANVIKVDERKGRPVIFYEYYVNKIKYEYAEGCNNCSLKIGDKILIKYSIKDKDVSKVVSFFRVTKYFSVDTLFR